MDSVLATSDPAAGRVAEAVEPAADPAAGRVLGELGVGGDRATLVHFSTAFCAPCRAMRRVAGEVAAIVPGVRAIEVDAESHLEAVRALGIEATPTLLIVDEGGRIVRRASGVPNKAQLIAALAAVLI